MAADSRTVSRMKSTLISSRYPLTITAPTQPLDVAQAFTVCAPAGFAKVSDAHATMIVTNAQLTILRTRRPPEEKSGSCAVSDCTTGDHRCREGRGRQNDGDGDHGAGGSAPRPARAR